MNDNVIQDDGTVSGSVELIALRQNPFPGWCRLDVDNYINLNAGMVVRFEHSPNTYFSQGYEHLTAPLLKAVVTTPSGSLVHYQGRTAVALREALLDSVVDSGGDYTRDGCNAPVDPAEENEG